MWSSEPQACLDAPARRELLSIARASIDHGLRFQTFLDVDADAYAPPLSEPGATFVTLKREGELRGCIGTLKATQSLVQDVARHAYAAAFEDPRFRPLRREELERLGIEVSVISPMEPLAVVDEDSLLAALRPGVDGLVLTAGYHRATFLPSVWQQLENPREFLLQLRHKAGLPLDYWAQDLSFQRYTTESFHG